MEYIFESDIQDCEPSYEQYKGFQNTAQYYLSSSTDEAFVTVPCYNWEGIFQHLIGTYDHILINIGLFSDINFFEAENFCR